MLTEAPRCGTCRNRPTINATCAHPKTGKAMRKLAVRWQCFRGMGTVTSSLKACPLYEHRPNVVKVNPREEGLDAD